MHNDGTRINTASFHSIMTKQTHTYSLIYVYYFHLVFVLSIIINIENYDAAVN